MAYVGAVKALEEAGIMGGITRFAGSSAGAIMAAALAVGYTADEMHQVMKDTAFSDFMDDTPGFIRDAWRLFNHYGIHRGDYFYNWFGNLMHKKTGNRDITFKQVYKSYKKVVVITGTCVNKQEVHYYHHLSNPDMPLRKAVRISMSIPIFFKAVRWEGDILADGGVLDNYPLHVFDGIDGSLPDSKKQKPSSTSSQSSNIRVKVD